MFNFSDILGLVDNLQGTIVGNALGLKDEEKEKVSLEIEKFRQNMELQDLKLQKEFLKLQNEKDLAILNSNDTFVRRFGVVKYVIKYLVGIVFISILGYKPSLAMDFVKVFKEIPTEISYSVITGFFGVYVPRHSKK